MNIYTVRLLLSISSGILAAQLISFFHVFNSNANISIFPAFAGAIFISLTAGIALSTSSFCLIIILKNFIKSHPKYFAITYFFIWLIISVITIWKGEGVYTVAYMLFIPFVIFYVLNLLSANTICRLFNSTKLKSNQKFLIAIIATTISIIGVFYYFNCDKDFFLRVRDYLILSSKLGEIFNDFYYRYTLYAAEAIRPASYKLIRFLSLIGLTAILPTIIYLTIFFINLYSINFAIKRVKIYRTMPTIVFQINKLAIPISPTPVPLPNGEGDNNYSLPLGRVGEGQNNYLESYKTINIPAIIAGVINIVIALFIFYRLYPLHTISMPLIHTTKPIWSTKTMLYHQEDYRIRVEGLRALCKENREHKDNRGNKDDRNKNWVTGNRDNIWNYPEFIATMIKQNNPTYKISGNIVEKYWLANALGAAKKLDALPYLEKLINDPSINVQCAAIEAMTTISINNSNLDISHFFEDKIVNSNELYVQKRAYNALKRLEKL